MAEEKASMLIIGIESTTTAKINLLSNGSPVVEDERPMSTPTRDIKKNASIAFLDPMNPA